MNVDLMAFDTMAFDTTGYYIQLKVKPFDNMLNPPDNYTDCEDDLPSLVNKNNIRLNVFTEKTNKFIDNAINEDGSHITISKVARTLFKDTIVFDEDADLWFNCNTRNIWGKSKSAFIPNGLLLSVVSDVFKI
jgi:hypothetical protein